jgi:hypothetical protein
LRCDVDLSQRVSLSAYEMLTGLSQANASGMPNEQGRTYVVFEIAYPSAYGGYPYTFGQGSLPKASMLGCCSNVSKVAQFNRLHAVSPCMWLFRMWALTRAGLPPRRTKKLSCALCSTLTSP